jgi:hypothetical protein
VTPSPTAYAAIGVPTPITISVDLRFIPKAPISSISPKASPMPAARPKVDPTRPRSTASVSTERRTWRRSAPSARNRPSSRVRWAMSMEKVLTMRKMPTSVAIPAKPSITYLMTSRNPPSEAAADSACSSAVRYSYDVGPSSSAIRRLSRSSLTPGSAVTEMLVAASGSPSSAVWAARVSR